MGTTYRPFSFPVCMNCNHHFWYGEMMFHSKHGYRNFICQKCSERENMPNIKITAEVDGKQVPLETVSTETFEAIKALEKPKEIPVVRVGNYIDCPSDRRLFLKISDSLRRLIMLNGGEEMVAINLQSGIVNNSWKDFSHDLSYLYENVQPL